jgi:hypothetical protein
MVSKGQHSREDERRRGKMMHGSFPHNLDEKLVDNE